MNERRGRLDALAAMAGFVGASVIAIGSIVAAVAYKGSRGEAYDPFNHFVSELGEIRNSELAVVFNLALIVGGICFVILMIGIAYHRGGYLALFAGVAGSIAGIGGAFVGMLPMDVSQYHAVAAFTFFNLGWIAIGLASVDFVRRRERAFPAWLSLIGALTVILFLGFLFAFSRYQDPEDGLTAPISRPDLSVVTILEWLVIVGIMGWAFLTGVTWLRAQRAESPR